MDHNTAEGKDVPSTPHLCAFKKGEETYTHTHATVAGRGVTQKSPMVTEKKTSKLFVHFSQVEIREKKKKEKLYPQ